MDTASVDEPRTQWESISPCCRMLMGLETSKTVAATLEFQFGSKILLKNWGILCMLHPGNDLCNNSSGRSVLCKDSAATLSFVKRSLNDKYDGTMKGMVQRQERCNFLVWNGVLHQYDVVASQQVDESSGAQ